MWCEHPFTCHKLWCPDKHCKEHGPHNILCMYDTLCKSNSCEYAHPIRDKNKITYLESRCTLQDKEIAELKAKIASLELESKNKDQKIISLESKISIEITTNTELKSKVVDYEKRFDDIKNIVNFSSSRKRFRTDNKDTEVEDELPKTSPVSKPDTYSISTRDRRHPEVPRYNLPPVPTSRIQRQISLDPICPTCGVRHKGQHCKTDD
jgi:uncharacterized coiled-coil protein SlyX